MRSVAGGGEGGRGAVKHMILGVVKGETNKQGGPRWADMTPLRPWLQMQTMYNVVFGKKVHVCCQMYQSTVCLLCHRGMSNRMWANICEEA
jgi:hypothetical protein